VFKSIGNVLSGKIARQNKAMQYSFTEPLERFKSCNLKAKPEAQALAHALTTTIVGLVDTIIFRSERPYLLNTAKTVPPDGMRRISAVLASRIMMTHIANVAAETDMMSEEPGFLDTMKAAAAALPDVMYPLDDVSRRAVVMFQDGEAAAENGGTIFYAVNAIRLALGIAPVNPETETLDSMLLDQVSLTSYLAAFEQEFTKGFQGGL
jgi:hypothetical protein